MRLFRRWLIAGSISLMAFATPAFGSELPDDWLRTVTDYVTEALTETGAPGAAVVIVDGDGVLLAEGFGVCRGRGSCNAANSLPSCVDE